MFTLMGNTSTSEVYASSGCVILLVWFCVALFLSHSLFVCFLNKNDLVYVVILQWQGQGWEGREPEVRPWLCNGCCPLGGVPAVPWGEVPLPPREAKLQVPAFLLVPVTGRRARAPLSPKDRVSPPAMPRPPRASSTPPRRLHQNFSRRFRGKYLCLTLPSRAGTRPRRDREGEGPVGGDGGVGQALPPRRGPGTAAQPGRGNRP